MRTAGPKGSLDGAHQSYTIAANDQLSTADAYRNLVVAYRNGAPVMLGDVAQGPHRHAVRGERERDDRRVGRIDLRIERRVGQVARQRRAGGVDG
jgi:multidrug efflux pump subunit AcrB